MLFYRGGDFKPITNESICNMEGLRALWYNPSRQLVGESLTSRRFDYLESQKKKARGKIVDTKFRIILNSVLFFGNEILNKCLNCNNP